MQLYNKIHNAYHLPREPILKSNNEDWMCMRRTSVDVEGCMRREQRRNMMDMIEYNVNMIWATWQHTILWSIYIYYSYLCVKRPAINVTAAAATINPKSKDRCHILYRRWYYTANANAISTYSFIRKECSTRSLEDGYIIVCGCEEEIWRWSSTNRSSKHEKYK